MPDDEIHVFKRKGGKYYYFWYWRTTPDGKKVQVPKTTKETLKAQAKEKAKKLLAKIKGTEKKIVTLADLFAPYFSENTIEKDGNVIINCPRQKNLVIDEKPMGQEHMKAQRSLIRRYVFTHPISQKNKDELIRGDIIDFVISCKNKYGSSLTHSIMKAFKTCWKDCLFRGEVMIDIVAGLGNIKYKEKERDALSVAEESLVFSSNIWPFRNAREKITFLLADKAGLRQGEVLALPWEDVDFKNHVIWINHAWKNFYKRRMDDPKWNKKRVVPMCKKLEDELQRYYKSILTCRPEDFVICWDDGSPISPSTWEDWWKHVKDTLNKDKVQINPDSTPHWLRHTCATRWEEGGLSERLIQLYLGHSKKKTSEKYKHPSVEYMVKKLREKF